MSLAKTVQTRRGRRPRAGSAWRTCWPSPSTRISRRRPGSGSHTPSRAPDARSNPALELSVEVARLELSVGVADANQLSTSCVRQGRLHRYGAHLCANVGVVDDDEFACVLERLLELQLAVPVRLLDARRVEVVVAAAIRLLLEIRVGRADLRIQRRRADENPKKNKTRRRRRQRKRRRRTKRREMAGPRRSRPG